MIRAAVASLLALAAPVAAHATVVNIDAAVSGCTNCYGNHPGPGNSVGTMIAPALLTLGPGTYNVTNAVGDPGALYDAWRFNGSEQNWIWAFIIADAATSTVVLDSLSDPAAFVGTHSAVANASYALNYSGSFTLASTTQLAFMIEDYGVYDNAGGVSLRIADANSAAPEPASWALMLAGFGAVGSALRSRRAAKAATA